MDSTAALADQLAPVAGPWVARADSLRRLGFRSRLSLAAGTPRRGLLMALRLWNRLGIRRSHRRFGQMAGRPRGGGGRRNRWPREVQARRRQRERDLRRFFGGQGIVAPGERRSFVRPGARELAGASRARKAV